MKAWVCKVLQVKGLWPKSCREKSYLVSSCFKVKEPRCDRGFFYSVLSVVDWVELIGNVDVVCLQEVRRF